MERAMSLPSSAQNPVKASLGSWSVSLVLLQRVQVLGFVDAVNRKTAEAAAVKQFRLGEWQRRRLILQVAGN
jgi:hypothetical protein